MMFTRVALCLLAFCGAASAQDYGPETVCKTALVNLDSQKRDQAGPAVNYIRGVMQELDDRHTQNGKPGILAQMSDQGFGGLVVYAMVRCREHPGQTVFSASAEAYRNFRDLETTGLGAAQ